MTASIAEIILLPLISLVVGLRARAIGTWLRVVDHPDGHRKTHSAATPLVGGLAVTAPLLIACAQRLWEGPDSAVAGALMIAVGGAFLLGFFDDRKQMLARVRFLATIALVVVSLEIVPAFVVAQFNFSFLRETIPLHSFSVIFTILVVVGMINAGNMADGMNGLLCGLFLIWSIFLLFYVLPQIMPILVLRRFSRHIPLYFKE